MKRDIETIVYRVVLFTLVLLAVMWPYLLGTYIAVELGAWNPSTERFVVGWIFEVFYVAGLVAYFLIIRARNARRAAEEEHRITQLSASGVVYQAIHGRSVVYRHGDCTVNHRSAETARKCGKSSIDINPGALAEPAQSDYPVGLDGDAIRLALGWATAIAGVGVVVGLGILVADPIHSAAEDASLKSCPAGTSTSGAPANITMPDLVGRNAGDAEDRLKVSGFTSVKLSSANPNYESVIVASNWTVVSTDPAPGCVVNRSHNVVVYVTK